MIASAAGLGTTVDASATAVQQQVAALGRLSQPSDGINIVRSLEEAAKLYENASTPEEQKLKDTASEFTSLLFGMMFQEMDKTVERTGLLDGGRTEEMFRSFVYNEYSKSASRQSSMSMTHRIYEQLYDATVKKKASPAAAGLSVEA